MTTPAKAAIGLCLGVGIFFAGYIANRQQAPVAPSNPARRILYYACPMHPQYRSDKPGDAPCCGMRLEPVYADSPRAKQENAAPEGAVAMGAGQRQLIGVRTDVATRAPASHLLRLPGRIAVDEARLVRLIAAVDGWLRELGQNPAGSFVKKDETLASYYASNLLASSQTLLYNISVNEQTPAGGLTPQRAQGTLSLQVAIDSLRSLGMSDRQIEEIQRTRQGAPLIHIYSPIAGFVIARNVSPGQRFDKGTEMFRIADISHVWVMTDIFEKDQQFVKPGTTATVRYQGRAFQAKMSDALPQLDPQSRTLKTRFELDNPGFVLRPDTFVDVELDVTMPASITVPAEAVIDSGRHRTVYIDRGSGYFEPRTVETGWRLGDRVQIIKGLEPGEHIVVSGNFLIDSESRMKFAQAGTTPAPGKEAGAEKDLVCGMDVDPKNPKAIKTVRAGKTYYFCSEQCKNSFEANPAKYARGPA